MSEIEKTPYNNNEINMCNKEIVNKIAWKTKQTVRLRPEKTHTLKNS